MSAVPIRVLIHPGSGSGIDAMTGKECDGITVTFEDGTVSSAFLGWKSFKQLLGMKARQNTVPASAPPVRPNGPATAVPVK